MIDGSTSSPRDGSTSAPRDVRQAHPRERVVVGFVKATVRQIHRLIIQNPKFNIQNY
jgi:hypothetical protein